MPLIEEDCWKYQCRTITQIIDLVYTVQCHLDEVISVVFFSHRLGLQCSVLIERQMRGLQCSSFFVIFTGLCFD